MADGIGSIGIPGLFKELGNQELGRFGQLGLPGNSLNFKDWI